MLFLYNDTRIRRIGDSRPAPPGSGGVDRAREGRRGRESGLQIEPLPAFRRGQRPVASGWACGWGRGVPTGCPPVTAVRIVGLIRRRQRHSGPVIEGSHRSLLLLLRHLAVFVFFGLHSRASFWPSDIRAGVIVAATISRCSTALSRSFPGGKLEAARSYHA